MRIATLRRPEVGIALALAIAPVAGIAVGGARPLLFALFALALGVFAYGLLRRHAAAARLPAVALAALVLLGLAIASALQALEPGQALADITWLAVAVALMLATLQICQTRRQVLVVAAGAVAGLAVAALHGLVQRATGQHSDISFVAAGEVVQRVSGAFGHPNQYAGLLAVLIPLALAMATARHLPARLRAGAAVAVLLALPALAFAYTRGAIVGLFVGGVLSAGVPRVRRSRSAPCSSPPWWAACSPHRRCAIASRPNRAVTSRCAPTSGGRRWTSMPSTRCSAPASATSRRPPRPPRDAGVEAQRRLLHAGQVLVPPHAQNLYLNLLAEQGALGLLGFALLALLALATAVRGARARDPLTRAIALGLGGGLLTGWPSTTCSRSPCSASAWRSRCSCSPRQWPCCCASSATAHPGSPSSRTRTRHHGGR